MSKQTKSILSRRDFVRLSAAAAAGLSTLPLVSFDLNQVPKPMKRKFGKIDFEVTTLGLGGQASIQWTPEDVNPESIILKAFKLGVNYFDTSNLYGESQSHYGKAFRTLNLIPEETGYDKKLRESVFLTTKTHIRWAKGGYAEIEGVGNWTNGDQGEGAIADLKRSLTQMFGDGKGFYPEGAYVNMVLIHSLNTTADIDVVYKGLETPLNTNENFGALVALRDFRDGTNKTGMNPKNEKLIRHIGFSGHRNSPAMMEMIRRDEYDLLDAMLVAINPNDKLYLSHQNNVIPVAKEKNMGIIAMKVFADGAMYTKESRWSKTSADVVRTVGDEELPSKPLVEYALTAPGIHTAIIGIGQISGDNLKCQLVQNYYAAQISPDGMSKEKRENLERRTAMVKEGKTNWFQMEKEDLSPPQKVAVNSGNKTDITWDSAIAADEPISHYEIYRENEMLGTVTHAPQTSIKPFAFSDSVKGDKYRVVTVDKLGRKRGVKVKA